MRSLRLTLAGALSVTALVAGTLATSASASTTLTGCSTATFKTAGKLTVGTDNPVYEPWFSNSTPSNGKGYEAGLVYAMAKKLGIAASKVQWQTVPFNSSYAPGTKTFDFDINEISYTADRASAVSFSNSYYDVQQSVVVLKSSYYAKHHKLSDLKKAKFGDQVGTTGLDYINNNIHPTTAARQYDSLDLAVAALTSKQIDAIVVDTPTGNYMVNWQIVDSKSKPLAVQVGQFKSVGEHYGLVLQKDSNLLTCVNSAIASLKKDGTIAKLTKSYLKDYTSVPLIK